MLGGGIGRNGLFRHFRPRGHFPAHGIFKRAAFHAVCGRNGPLLKRSAFGIPCIGHKPKTRDALVALFPSLQEVAGKFGGVAQQNNKHARGHGIKRAGMADFLLAQTLDAPHALRGTHASRLVDNQNSMQLFHVNVINSCKIPFRPAKRPATPHGKRLTPAQGGAAETRPAEKGCYSATARKVATISPPLSRESSSPSIAQPSTAPSVSIKVRACFMAASPHIISVPPPGWKDSFPSLLSHPMKKPLQPSEPLPLPPSCSTMCASRPPSATCTGLPASVVSFQ